MVGHDRADPGEVWRGMGVHGTTPESRPMNEDPISAERIHADRMLAAMQRASHAFANQNAKDPSVLCRLWQPGTALAVAVHGYVAYLKGTGLAPEQFLIAVKLSVIQFDRIPQQIESRALMEGVISLCIAEYYSI